ncbi:MAG: enoyl-CoA hydratase-related protein [Tepidanaerobacteraceae bacterium]
MGFVKLEQQGHVGIITIDRQEALNALNSQVLTDLNDVLDQVESNKDIYVAVLTGAGRSFVAGADIGEMKNLNAVQAKAFSDYGNNVFLRIENLSKPIIAAVNGFALGGGCEISMACDIRLASEKAKFGQPEVSLGITPGFGGTQRLPRLVGSARAMELILTARVIGAAEAESIGLVNAVYPPAQLMPKALEMANAIAKQAQVAVRASKQCIRKGMQTDINTGATYEAMAFAVCFDTEDQIEGMSAFLEKRAEKHFKNK